VSDGNELVVPDGAMGCFSAGASAVGRIRQQLGELFSMTRAWCAVFADWVQELSNLDWIAGRVR